MTVTPEKLAELRALAEKQTLSLSEMEKILPHVPALLDAAEERDRLRAAAVLAVVKALGNDHTTCLRSGGFTDPRVTVAFKNLDDAEALYAALKAMKAGDV